MSAARENLARAITLRDYMRRPPRSPHAEPGHKEWLHFAAYGKGVDVLLNFSLADDVAPRAPLGVEVARLSCIVRDDRWHGDVVVCPAESVHAPGGRLDVAFGENSVKFEDGAYRLSASLPRRGVQVELVLEPDVYPVEANNVVIDDCPPMNWVVVPRLRASGVVRAGGRTHVLVDAPAYHDHNWGRFGWGKDFAWEWGYALPEVGASPFCLAFVRLSDRGRRVTLMQGMFVWNGALKSKLFRDGEVTVTTQGLLRPDALFKLPRVMSLVRPGGAVDVPARLHVAGSSGRDELHLDFRCEDVAQIVVPNDSDLGVTVINEVVGTSRVEGTIRGERVAFTGRSICEFLGG